MAGVEPAIRDEELRLRRFAAADAAPLQSLLAEPEVARWWPDGEIDGERGWVVEVDGRAAGWIEYEQEAHHWYPQVAFDLFLTSSLHGRGYGRRVLRLAIEHFARRGHHRFTLDPNARIERAIRCYAAVGFERVGLMRNYERNPADGFDDALLMDLIVTPAARGA